VRDYSKEPYVIRMTIEKGQRELIIKLPDDFPVGWVEVTINYIKKNEDKFSTETDVPDDLNLHP
jgi:hypothetical protein